MKNLYKFIRDLFSSKPKKDPKEMFIILDDMKLCYINDSSKYKDSMCKLFLGERVYDKIACKIAKLIKGKTSKLDYVPEGYGIEILPDIYCLTSTSPYTKITLPIVLRKAEETGEYEFAYLSKTNEKRLKHWWDIKNAIHTLSIDTFILEKITPKSFKYSNTDESIDFFYKLFQ